MLPRKTAAALRAMRRNGIAWLALFVALGGTGYAAATIGPGDIQNDAVRARHIAAGAVWSGQIHDGAIRSSDVQDDAIRTRQIRGGAVLSSDIANRTVRGADLKANTVSGTEVNEFSLRGVTHAFTADSASDAHTAESLDGDHVFSDANNNGVFLPSDGSSEPIATVEPHIVPSGQPWLFLGTLSVFNNDPTSVADGWRCKLDVAGTQRDQAISLPLAPEGDVGYGTSLSFQVRGFVTDEDPDPGLYCTDNDDSESVFVGPTAVTAIPLL